MNRRVLVLGGNRFFGKQLVHLLLDSYAFQPLQGWLPPLVQSVNVALAQSPSGL